MAILVLLGVMACAAVVLGLMWGQAREARDAWELAARDLGLEFQPTFLFRGQRIMGDLEGMQVRVNSFTRKPHRQSSVQYTRYRVRYPHRLGMGMKLCRQHRLTMAVGKIFGMKDIPLGDPRFDEAVLVQAKDEGRIRAFMTTERRDAVYAALNRYEAMYIRDDCLRLEHRGLDDDSERLAETVREFVALARVLVGEVTS